MTAVIIFRRMRPNIPQGKNPEKKPDREKISGKNPTKEQLHTYIITYILHAAPAVSSSAHCTYRQIESYESTPSIV